MQPLVIGDKHPRWESTVSDNGDLVRSGVAECRTSLGNLVMLLAWREQRSVANGDSSVAGPSNLGCLCAWATALLTSLLLQGGENLVPWNPWTLAITSTFAAEVVVAFPAIAMMW
jgi:hypothetical protein